MEEDEVVIQNVPQPKGMFGIKGNFRDILGTIGDAFLVQANKDRVYAPQRQLENEARAVFDMQDHPEDAIRRLLRVNPQAGREELQNYQNNRIKNSILERETRKANAEYEDEAREVVSRYMGAATPENWPMLYKRISDFAKTRGYDISDIPTTFNQEQIDTYRMSGVPTKDQLMNEYRGRRADQFDRGYDIREAGQAATNEYRNRRAGQMERGLDIRDRVAADNKAYRDKRLEQLDRKTPSGGGSQGLPAPRKKNDKIRNPSTGEIISSSDGKNWDYKSTDGKTWTKR